MSRSSQSQQIPLFPLSTLVMPGGLLPLRLFEPRYLDMIKRCFKSASGFGVCLIAQGNEVGSGARPYPRGTLVRIIDFEQGNDGLLHIMVQGEYEFALQDYQVEADGLLLGQVNYLEPAIGGGLAAQYQSLAKTLERILRHVEPQISYPQKYLDDSLWVSNRLLELLPLDAESKYQILCMHALEERLETLSKLKLFSP